MSVYGMMRTGASGMNAQSNRLGAVSDNIANASTVGYKASSAEFSALLVGNSTASYTSGGVETAIRYGISEQGALTFTGSALDLAINGSGFMLVSAPDGSVSLTRAGAFVPNGDGQLVNSAGFTLLGLPIDAGVEGDVVVNGTAGLVPVDVRSNRLEAVPSTVGLLTANLPSGATDVAPADMPSVNGAASVSTARSSVVVYGNLGDEVVLDVHFARATPPGTLPSSWEVAVFDSAGRSPAGGFPYAAAPLSSVMLEFDASGQLTTASPQSISVPVPGGVPMTFDLSATSQLASAYSVLELNANGNAPGDVKSVEISGDGTLYETFDNGSRRAAFRIPLATVVSADRLVPRSGNVFEVNSESGDVRVGLAGSGGLGGIVSGALESSTVDLANELTDMIEAQRNYTANSRVFQTGAELLEVLVNLKR